MLESFLENTKAVCERVGIPTPESNDELTESTPLGIDTSCPPQASEPRATLARAYSHGE